MKATICMHTYTGNDLIIGETFHKAFKNKGIDSELFTVTDPDREYWNKELNPDKKLITRLNDIKTAEPEDILNSDIIIFGAPTAFGSISAAMKNFLEKLQIYYLGADLKNKKTACFTSASSVEGGACPALMNFILFAQHMGMLHIPVPVSVQQLCPGISSYGIIHHSGFDSGSRPDDNLKNAIHAFAGHIIQL